MQTEAAPAGNTDATAAQPKPPHDVEELFKGWVLPKFDAVENNHNVSDLLLDFDDVWEVWAPCRYQLHSKKMGTPNLPELCNAMTNTKISYNGSRLHLLGEWRDEEGAASP